MQEATSLLRLQEVDLQLLRLNATLAGMPHRAKLVNIGRAKRKLASQLKQVVGQRKDVEMELDDNKASLAETLGKIEAVKADISERVDSYRRIQDLEAHLTALAKRQEKIEYAQEDIVRRLERLRTAEANAKALGERLLAEERATKESYTKASADLKAQVASLEQERAALAASLSPDTLATYEAASKRFDGLAVEEMRSNTPSVCRVKLQASLYSSVMRGPRITQCPYCHRMLVVQEIGS